MCMTVAGVLHVRQRPSPLPRWRWARSAVQTAPACRVTSNFASCGVMLSCAPRRSSRLIVGSACISARLAAATVHSCIRMSSRHRWATWAVSGCSTGTVTCKERTSTYWVLPVVPGCT
eukprot:3227136-Amphidinium_carterae.1